MRADIESRELIDWARQESFAGAKLVAKQKPLSPQPRKHFCVISPGNHIADLGVPLNIAPRS
jgi:hypothetical protein